MNPHREKMAATTRKHVEEVTFMNGAEETIKNRFSRSRTPLVIKSLDIGSCVDKWTWDYLKAACGKKLVKVHVCSSSKMDFLGKNFTYRTMTFEEFIQRIVSEKQLSPYFSKDEKYYLRSIGGNPRKDIADIRKEFPELSADVKFPKLFDEDSFFSSVFRMSSRSAQLWTHYDVMDNLLMVVSGVKRVVLYSPKDALYLYLKGDKSEVLDIDNPDLERFPDFQKAVPHEVILHPGDVLFIPALWFHNVINVESGVAVNVFWRHLSSEQYDSNDTYGNKDLVAASRAGQVLDRALKLLDTLPDDYRDFYARQMIVKIQTKLSSDSSAIS